LATVNVALVLTSVVVVAELAPAEGSLVCAATVAVLLIVVPPGVDDLTWAMSVMVAEAPLPSVALLQVTTPPLPTEGAVQAKLASLGVTETNVVLNGSESVTTTFCASLGPALLTVNVQVRLPPAVTGSGESLFVIETSAEVLTSVEVAFCELFDGFGSGVAGVEPEPSEVICAALAMSAPTATLAGTRTL
jgi:hypothetical protein